MLTEEVDHSATTDDLGAPECDQDVFGLVERHAVSCQLCDRVREDMTVCHHWNELLLSNEARDHISDRIGAT